MVGYVCVCGSHAFCGECVFDITRKAMEEAAAASRQEGEGHKQELLEARRSLALARANAQEAQQRLRVQEALLEDRNAVIQGTWNERKGKVCWWDAL